MNKLLVGALTLGLIIGVGSLGASSFADEKVVDTQFKVLNQETNKFETLDDSQYRNSNSNYGQCCSAIGYEDSNIK